jgi:3-polyprenyl-4-hydroxybenzoate decarboxylase
MDLYQMMLTTTIPQEVLTHFMTNLKQDEDLMECKANPIQVPEIVLESTADMALEVEFEGNTDDYDEYTGATAHDGQAEHF